MVYTRQPILKDTSPQVNWARHSSTGSSTDNTGSHIDNVIEKYIPSGIPDMNNLVDINGWHAF